MQLDIRLPIGIEKAQLWDAINAVLKRYPEVTAEEHVYHTRMTTAGGTAGIDLVLSVRSRGNADLARQTSDHLLYSGTHLLQQSVSVTLPGRVASNCPILKQAITLMENSLENPLSASVIASRIKVSSRQLQRVFHRSLATSPKRYMIGLQLDRAYRLLIQTEMSIMETAFASGFCSSASFSNAFRRRFGHPPSHLRQRRSAVKR
jgi:AraC family carnitine catabolism transcriptional activator